MLDPFRGFSHGDGGLARQEQAAAIGDDFLGILQSLYLSIHIVLVQLVGNLDKKWSFTARKNSKVAFITVFQEINLFAEGAQPGKNQVFQQFSTIFGK